MKTIVASVFLAGLLMIGTGTAQAFQSHPKPGHAAKHRALKATKHRARGDHHHRLSLKKKH